MHVKGGKAMIAEKVQELEQENTRLKVQVQKLWNICGGVELPKNCKFCENFIQHYIRSGESYYPTYDGRCAAGNRIKNRKVSDTCKAYTKKVYGRNYI